jgi:hypothetical protein
LAENVAYGQMPSDDFVSPKLSTSSAIFGLFCVYLVTLILLPSGTVNGVPVKVLLFVPLVIAAARLLLLGPSPLEQTGFAFVVAALLCLSTVWSLFNPYYSEFVLSHVKDIVTTLVGCWMIRLFAQSEWDQLRIVKVCLLAVAVGSVLKVGLLTYAFLTGTSVSTYVDHISTIFGVKLMSIDLADAGGRLQFPSDNLIPPCLFALLTLRRRVRVGWYLALPIFVILLASSLYTFSRYIWLSTVLATALGLFIGRKDRLNLFYLTITGLVVVAFFPILVTVISLRFSSNLSGASDEVRIWQIAVLEQFFASAPLWGHGLGSYAQTMKRSYDLPYAYEVQVLAMLGQFGLIGCGLLVMLLVNYYRKVFSFASGVRMSQAAVFLLLLNLLGAGFFNPSLLVSMSAVGYGLLFILARLTQVQLEDYVVPRKLFVE